MYQHRDSETGQSRLNCTHSCCNSHKLLGSDSEAADNMLLTVSSLTATLPAAAAAVTAASKHAVQFVQ